jgi:hypothetical protein
VATEQESQVQKRYLVSRLHARKTYANLGYSLPRR